MMNPEPMLRALRRGRLPKKSLKYRSKGVSSSDGPFISDIAVSERLALTLTTAGLSSRPILTQSGACTVGAAAVTLDCSVHSCGCAPLVRPKPVVTPPRASAATRASAGQLHFLCLRNPFMVILLLVCEVRFVLPEANVAGAHEERMRAK